MSVVSFKKIKEISESVKQTHVIDLGDYIDKQLEGVTIPIRVKSIEESIQLKNNFNPSKESLTITYTPYRRIPKALKDIYAKDGNYRKGITENTYLQVLEYDKDIHKIERRKYRERLFNILIHLDMDYIIEDGKTMWEDAGLKKGDYNGLIDLFSGIIRFENHLDMLDIVIDQIKNGVTDKMIINAHILNYTLRKTVDAIEDEDEKKVFVENLRKAMEKDREDFEKSISKETVKESE